MICFAQGVFGEIRTLEMLNALVGSTGKELVLDWPSALRVRILVVLNENAFNSHSTCILFKTGKLSLDTRALRDESHHFR